MYYVTFSYCPRASTGTGRSYYVTFPVPVAHSFLVIVSSALTVALATAYCLIGYSNYVQSTAVFSLLSAILYLGLGLLLLSSRLAKGPCLPLLVVANVIKTWERNGCSLLDLVVLHTDGSLLSNKQLASSLRT